MKKTGKQSNNAVTGIAGRLGRGVVYNNEDLWKDEPEVEAQPANDPDTSASATQRRRRRSSDEVDTDSPSTAATQRRRRRKSST